MRTLVGQARTTALTLDQLARHYGFSDDRLSDLTGRRLSRATIQGRRAGRKALDTEELEMFADAFGVPVQVLLMEPADAVRWVLDNVDGAGIPRTAARQAPRFAHAPSGAGHVSFTDGYLENGQVRTSRTHRRRSVRHPWNRPDHLAAVPTLLGRVV